MRPFQLESGKLNEHIDRLVQSTFDDISSQFMLLPKGDHFIHYERFLDAYECLRRTTSGFEDFSTQMCWKALRIDALSFVVIRCILGVSPPEWQDITQSVTGGDFPVSFARGVDSACRGAHSFFTTGAGQTELTTGRVQLMLEAAVSTLVTVPPTKPDGTVHRLHKIDTQTGLESLHYVSQYHIPYAVLLYERYLGRPYASHRDAVSELVGDVMETGIEDQLTSAGIPFRKAKRAERVPGFDQAPDFFVPDELAPSVIIEAKISADDGTARDKVARILRLVTMRNERIDAGERGFQVVACIDGRGFSVRRQDMQDLIEATDGKVFTLKTLPDLVNYTDLAHFVTPAKGESPERPGSQRRLRR